MQCVIFSSHFCWSSYADYLIRKDWNFVLLGQMCLLFSMAEKLLSFRCRDFLKFLSLLFRLYPSQYLCFDSYFPCINWILRGMRTVFCALMFSNFLIPYAKKNLNLILAFDMTYSLLHCLSVSSCNYMILLCKVLIQSFWESFYSKLSAKQFR